MATVIDAAQRKGQLDNETTLKNSELFNQSLTAIGTIGKSLMDTKKRVAQSLALGRQFDIPDDVAKTMEPEQILQVGALKKGNVDMNMLLNILHPGSGGTGPQVPMTPASGSSTSPEKNGAMLASDTTTTPVQDTPSPVSATSPAPLMPPTTAQVPVPIQAPPLKPPSVNKATFDAAMKLSNVNRMEPVITRAVAEAQGGVRHGTHILPDEKSGPKDIMDPAYQGKLEKQYADMRLKALSNRSGGLGLQDSKVNQAFDLRKLVNKYYDPKTGDFNIPPSQHSELALGLARLISPTGQVGIELMHELRQGTGREALAKALIYAGADPNAVGGPTQNVAKMFVDSVDRQGETAEQLRDQYMQYISDNAPTDLDPARKAKHDKGKLNSFNDFLSKSPDKQQVQPGSWDASKEQRYQELLDKRSGKGPVRS